MHDPLTPIERRVYHYLIDFLAEHTYQPSVREIGRRFRIRSTKTVAEVLQSLAEKGFIEKTTGRSRGVRLVGYTGVGHTLPIPLYERVNAGEPHLTSENRSRHIAVDRSFVPADDAFFVRASDDGMRDRGVLAGDLVLVNPAVRSREGDAVVARVNGETLVRLISHRGGAVALGTSDGATAEVVLGPRDDFSVLGVVAGVFRPFHDEPNGDGG
jgi:repressor LexA